MQQGVLTQFGLILVMVYLASLLLVGWWANRARSDDSIQDFYLAGSALGLFTLFFTMYATQYSGNTLLALPGKAYRSGMGSLGVAFGVMAVVGVYATFAPRLNALAKQHRFITLGDFVHWRYQSSSLRSMINLILMFTLISYALGNFKAIGLLLESASGAQISFTTAVLALAVIMAMYESLGGMRAVVWTDTIQGLLLMLGCLLIFACVWSLSDSSSVTHWAGFSEAASNYFIGNQNDTGILTDPNKGLAFISLVVLIGVGAAVYPQAIQRIFAAKNPQTLKRSFKLLLLMPILTTLPMILVGMSVNEWRSDLSTKQSEQVLIFAIEHIIAAYPYMAWLMILAIGAALAAIMSTIDSALLSLGSTVTGDFLAAKLAPLSEAKKRQVSRLVSWILMAIMATLAIYLPQTIWALMVFKFELLIQLAPAVILGVRSPLVTTKAVTCGLILGCSVAVIIKLTFGSYGGIHAGVWGLIANVLTIGLLMAKRKPKEEGL